MIFSRIARYLNYILLSHHRKGHGIHSPYIFNLVTRTFRNKVDPTIVSKIEQIRNDLISDNRILNINDLGSGAGKLKTSRKKVSEIARNSPVTQKYGKLLWKLAAEFGEPYILELGTSVGISAMYMAAAKENAIVYTIEGSPETAAMAKENFVKAGFENIRVLTGSFDEILPSFLRERSKPGMVFIDGNHRKEPVIRYFNQIAENAGDETVIIIDDINYSSEMAEAWDELTHHRKVSVSIDVFRMGILFFKQGITPNNYTIRY